MTDGDRGERGRGGVNGVAAGPAPASRLAGAIAIAVAAGLLALAPLPGFHRDELYFVVAGRHLAWGYVDQPPLTPFLSMAMTSLLGVTPVAVRILPALAVAACVLLAAHTARTMGGGSRAQALAALVVAVSGYLAAGHLGSTTTYDLLAWATILWLVARLLAGADPRLWIAVGLVAGLGLENKSLVLFLVVGLFVGLLAERRDALRSRWPWFGALVALALWAPNLAWQIENGLPQLTMAGRIAGNGVENRVQFAPQLLLLMGPYLFPVALAGLVALLRDASLRRFRPIATATLVIAAIVLASGGKSYYAIGTFPALAAAGAIRLERWLWRTDRLRPARAAVFGVAAAGSLVLVALLTLPVLPPATLAATPIPGIYPEIAESIGWPELVSTVEDVANGLPPGAAAHAVVLTANYGEAGALELLGHGLPPVYSGHNSYWSWGPPPDDRTTAIVVGWWSDAWLARASLACGATRTIDNGIGLDNQEQGAAVRVCSVARPWRQTWPLLFHAD